MSSKSNAILPPAPLISMRIAFLRPRANRVASNEASAPPVKRPRNSAASSTVTCPVPSPATPDSDPAAAGSGRSVTKVSSIPLTPVSRSPLMYCVRSTMWAPMSPSAPDPALSFSSRHDMGADGSAIQSCRYCARTCRIWPSRPSATSWRAEGAPGTRPAAAGGGGEAARAPPPVGEADHGPDTPGRGAGGGLGHGLGLGHGVGEGLLAEHVLARLEGRDGDLGVGVPGRADVDQRDVVPLENATPVGLGGRPAEPAGGVGHRGGVAAGQHGELRPQGQVEEVGGGAPGLRVRRAHEGVTDEADPDGGTVGGCHEGSRVRGSRGVTDSVTRRLRNRSVGQDSNALPMKSSTLSLVTTGASSTVRRGTPCEARSDMLLPWTMSRASLMPSAACVDG